MKPIQIRQGGTCLSVFRILALALALAATTLLFAQDDAESDDAFFDRVNVNVVNLDVSVLDAEGKPVTGLTADDFEVFEDGRPVKISNFYEVVGRRRVAATVPPEAVDSPGRPKLSLPLIDETEPLHVVVYIDNFNLQPRNRLRAMHHLRHFLLSELGRDARVALYTYDRPLNQRVPFTDDVDHVVNALDGIEEISASRSSTAADRRDALTAIFTDPPPPRTDRLIQFYARQVENDLTFSLGGLGNLMESISGLPGRKAVVYLSDGLPMRPGEDLYQARADRVDDPAYFMDSFKTDATERFVRLVQKANTEGITFYTVHAAGMRDYDIGSAEIGGMQGHTQANFSHQRNLQSSLQMMADDTGGLAIIGTNNLSAALDQVGDVLRNYYSLGYLPAHGLDGRYHEVEVKLKSRRNLRLDYRHGYRFKDRRALMVDRTTASLLHGYRRNTHDIALEMLATKPAGDDERAVPLLVRVPASKLTLLPRAERLTADMAVYVAAVDEEGRLSPVQTLPWKLDFPAEKLPADPDFLFTFQLEMTMRAGRQTIAVGFEEEVTGQQSFLVRSIVVGG